MVSYPQLSLLDVIPDDAPETGSPATVYDKPNVDHGHLLIETHVGDWMFVWTGGTSLRAYFPGLRDGIDLEALRRAETESEEKT